MLIGGLKTLRKAAAVSSLVVFAKCQQSCWRAVQSMGSIFEDVARRWLEILAVDSIAQLTREPGETDEASCFSRPHGPADDV
jgi:hypothetical protein